MTRARRVWIALFVATVAGAGTGAVVTTLRANARSRARAAELARAPTATELVVPRARQAPTIDGEFEDPAWVSPARTDAFVGVDGSPVHPHSEARFAWDDENLYVLLYAADENVQASRTAPDSNVWEDDSFHMILANGEREYSFDLSARGVVCDGTRPLQSSRTDGARPFDFTWQSGLRIAADLDGTIADPSDDDEEWVLELAIPLRSIGVTGRTGERVGITLRRCDTPKSSPRVCGTWPSGPGRALLVLGGSDS